MYSEKIMIHYIILNRVLQRVHFGSGLGTITKISEGIPGEDKRRLRITKRSV